MKALAVLTMKLVIIDFIRYFMVTIFAIGFFPWLFKKTRLYFFESNAVAMQSLTYENRMSIP